MSRWIPTFSAKYLSAVPLCVMSSTVTFRNASKGFAKFQFIDYVKTAITNSGGHLVNGEPIALACGPLHHRRILSTPASFDGNWPEPQNCHLIWQRLLHYGVYVRYRTDQHRVPP